MPKKATSDQIKVGNVLIDNRNNHAEILHVGETYCNCRDIKDNTLLTVDHNNIYVAASSHPIGWRLMV